MIGIATNWFLLWQLYDRFDFSSRFEGPDAFMGVDPRYDIGKPKRENGVVPRLMELGCDTFDPERIDERIRLFLMETASFEMEVATTWHSPFWKRVNRHYKRWVVPWIGNLNLPPDAPVTVTHSSIRDVDTNRDKTPDFAIWSRFVQGEKETLFYKAAFQSYVSRVGGEQRAYLAGAFPIRFPFGASQLAVVFRLENTESRGLTYSSVAEPSRILAEHEAGIYWLLPHRHSFSAFPGFGLREHFHFEAPSSDAEPLRCTHTSSLLGQKLFTLCYTIRPYTGPGSR